MFLKLNHIFIFGFLVSGCATQAVQTEALLRSPGFLSRNSLIQNVEFLDQSVGYCGPATLTMALRWAGYSVNVDEIASQAFTPNMKGSLQSDMISAARRSGAIAIPIRGLKELFLELEAGHPVIIFENLSLSWAPLWHYALVLGFDLDRQQVIMHSGHDAYFHWDMSKFERSWMLGDYWGLVVLPAGHLAVSGSERKHVTAVVGLERAGYFKAAEKSYRKILERWPQSLISLIGLANLNFKNGDINKAIWLLRKAQKFHPESEAVKHNLEVAENSLVSVR